MHHPSSPKHAFSLIELSIVLVILGLLTGGILSGQSLIRAAEIRSVTADYQRYAAAFSSFRDKYFALPGDMPNAVSFWGSSACPGTSATPSTSAATCNGDGNGLITTNATNSNEIFRFWQQLANAGLIEGSYSGVTNSATATDQVALIGTNVPRSKISNAGWSVYALSPSVPLSDTSFFEGSYGNSFFFGAAQASNITQASVLKPEEAWNIDTKLDDGKPATGNVRTFENLGPSSCHDFTPSANSSAGANYLLSSTAIGCMLIMKTSY